MLQCYVLMCGWSVTAFLSPPRSQRPGQGPSSPHPKAGPDAKSLEHICVLNLILVSASLNRRMFIVETFLWSSDVLIYPDFFYRVNIHCDHFKMCSLWVTVLAYRGLSLQDFSFVPCCTYLCHLFLCSACWWFLDTLTLEDGTSRLSLIIGQVLPTSAV
jgi:hypothetical protein